MNLLGGLLVGLGVLLIIPMLCVLLIIGAMPWLGVTPTSQTTAGTSSIVRTIDVAPAPAIGVGPDVFPRLLEVARSWLGVPYLWGGCSRNGVDCSCFIQMVYAAVGIVVPRTTVTQVVYDAVVPRAQIRPGDTLFFDKTCTNCGPNPTHAGLFIGGDLMLDCGDPCRIEPVYWNKLHSAGRPSGL